MHIRGQIRLRAVSLIEGLPDAPTVFQARPHAIMQDDLPAVNVATGDEEILFVQKGRIYQAMCPLYVAIRDEGDEDEIQDTLDAHSVRIHKAIMTGGGNAWNRLAQSIMLAATGPVYDDEGETVAGVILYTYHVTYRFQEDDPETALN